ncbi:MAG: hypothetical protein VX438_10755 [Planctomycetota bacterium]|nr:hypothetical protein [Planctomycetota bacterium]
MKTFSLFLLALNLMILGGCTKDPGTADVEFKPALKNPPPGSQPTKSMSEGMQMDPTKLMLQRLDKNRDGEITKDEFTDESVERYDLNQDGKISIEELKKRNSEISNKGLTFLGSDPDKGKKVKK